MVTPSLVIVGAPHFFSSTTLRPLGPSVTLTASASWFMPRSRARRASSLNAMILAMRWFLPRTAWGGPVPDARDGRSRSWVHLVGPGPAPRRTGSVTRLFRVLTAFLALDPGECKRVHRRPANDTPQLLQRG